jgi:hypothetical protein
MIVDIISKGNLDNISMPKMKIFSRSNHEKIWGSISSHETNPKKEVIDPVVPYILAGSDRSPFARGQGVTNTLWSWFVKGKPRTR